MNCKIVFIVHICFCVALSARAQIRFLHITNKDGLPSNNVRCVTQDYQGFMWIGTEDGLNRFDGKRMVTYRHSNGDSTSLSKNYIFAIFEDSRKNLWIGTLDGGLNLYDRKKDTFRRIGSHKDKRKRIVGNSITSILEARDGILVLGTEEGTHNYFTIPENIEESPDIFQLTEPIRADTLGETIHNGFTSAAVDREGNLWAHFYHYGVIKADLKKNKLFGESIRFDGDLQSTTVDSKNRMWIGTWHDGVFVVDLNTGRKAHFHAGQPNSLLHNFIPAVAEDHEGNIWIGTDEGVNLLKASDDPFTNPPLLAFEHDDEDDGSLVSNPVKAITVDRDGRVWIGSLYGGLSIYDKHAPPFQSVKRHPSLPGLLHNNVTAFAFDNDGNLWIGSDAGGINIVRGGIKNILQPKYEAVSLINSLTGEEEKKIKTITNDKKGNIWVGTWGGGIFKVNSRSLAVQHFGRKSTRISLPSNEITSLMADRADNLWVGTFGAGILHVNASNNSITRFANLQDDNSIERFQKINVIHESVDGTVWVAKESGGLGYVDPSNNTIVPVIDSVLTSDLTILSVLQDSAGIFWLATNAVGVLRFDPNKKISEVLDDRHGLESLLVHSVEMDNTGKLWLATNAGISVFNSESRRFTNYSKGTALEGNQFNNNSHIEDSDGTMMFGGNHGISFFHPRDIRSYTPQPAFAFTGFTVHNVPFNYISGNLSKNIILVDSIVLEHDQNSIGIEFSFIDFNFSADRRYAFMLERFNDQWQHIGQEQKAIFTNLAPGNYRFKVRSTIDGQNWIEASQFLHIRIRPAWWQTLLFKAGLFATALTLIIAVVRLRVKILNRRQQHLERLVKTRTFELNDKNNELARMVQEISIQNKELFQARLEMTKLNQEIQVQNEELKTQNEQILQQREELELAQAKLKASNDDLEKLVDARTRKLKTTIQELDKTVFELDRFVYSASHDLSAPLKSILGLLFLAKSEKNIDRLNEYHEYIQVSIHKLEMVIRSLVEYSRNAHMEVRVEPANVHNLVQEVISELYFLPESSYIKFYNKIDPAIEIDTDHYRLKIVLQNIINNAIKYSDPSKPESSVVVTCETYADKIQLSIIDNGIGIEAENLPKIFSMYFRATEKSKGSGLGLFIVKEMVQKLQGKISVTSEKWKTTEFTLVLPKTVKARSPVRETA